MKVSLEIPITGEKNILHWNGIAVSLLNLILEIFEKKRKGSDLIHFYLVRLDSHERRELIRILTKIILQIRKKNDDSKPLKENVSLSEVEIPLKLRKIFNFFQTLEVSNRTTGSLQESKVNSTSIKVKEVLKSLDKVLKANE